MKSPRLGFTEDVLRELAWIYGRQSPKASEVSCIQKVVTRWKRRGSLRANSTCCFHDSQTAQTTTSMYDDIGSAMTEYPDKTATLGMTAWEPTEWCNDCAIDIYGTNGSLHAVPDYPVAELYLREGRGGLMPVLPR